MRNVGVVGVRDYERLVVVDRGHGREVLLEPCLGRRHHFGSGSGSGFGSESCSRMDSCSHYVGSHPL